MTAKATGAGHRLVAALLGRPPETVRGWLRRFGARVEVVRAVFTGWCRDLAPDPVLPGPAGSAWADAVAAIGAAAAAVRSRFCLREVPVWQIAIRAASGFARRLLSRTPPAPPSTRDLNNGQHNFRFVLTGDGGVGRLISMLELMTLLANSGRVMTCGYVVEGANDLLTSGHRLAAGALLVRRC